MHQFINTPSFLYISFKYSTFIYFNYTYVIKNKRRKELSVCVYASARVTLFDLNYNEGIVREKHHFHACIRIILKKTQKSYVIDNTFILFAHLVFVSVCKCLFVCIRFVLFSSSLRIFFSSVFLFDEGFCYNFLNWVFVVSLFVLVCMLCIFLSSSLHFFLSLQNKLLFWMHSYLFFFSFCLT